MGYIFGGSTGETPESLKRKREVAEALLRRGATAMPQDLPQGLVAVAQALSGRIGINALDKQEAAGRAKSDASFDEWYKANMPSREISGTGGADVASGSAGSDTVDLSGDRQAFIDALLPAAIEQGKRIGVDPRIIVAQAAQETGWGRSAPGNNYFGIKSHGQDGGQNLTTHEVIDGKRVKINDSFRTFDSPGDSVAGYADFIASNPRYRPMMQAQGLDAQIAELGRSGYATDPNYANSVGAIARSIKMPTGNDVLPGGEGEDMLADAWSKPDPNRPGHGIDTRTGTPSFFSEPDPERFGPTTAPKGDRLTQAFQAQPPLTPEGVTVPTMIGDEKPAPRPTPRPQQPAVDPMQTAAVQPSPAMQPRGIVSPRAEDNGYTRGPGAAPANMAPQQAVAQALMRRQAAAGAPPVGNAPAGPAGGIPGISPSTAAMLSDPNLSEGQRAVVLSVLKQQMDAQDPGNQLDLDIKRARLNELQNPGDPNLLSPAALEQKIALQKAGKAETNVTVGGEPPDGELRKSLDKKTGEIWAGYSETGATSAAMAQDMQVLDELIKVAPQGPIGGRLAEMFPGVSSAGDAFQSVVKRVAPTLRAPGSGATSDIEYDGMLRSLPALRNQPEANAMIAEIMKSKASINIERARIVDAYGSGTMSAGDARKAIAELDKRSIMTPEMKKALEGLGGGDAAPAGGPAIGAVQDGYRFKGGDPADPNSWEPVN